MKITVDYLKNLGAGQNQVKLFEKFLNGQEYFLLTENNIQTVVESGLDVCWLFMCAKLSGHFEDNCGTKKWLQNGQYHREDGPAIEYANGDRYWLQNGQYHREDGPAIEWANGGKEWFQNDLLHRKDGPAIEYANGTKKWYQNGQLHRDDGPAIEKIGLNEWWFEGEKMKKHEVFEKARIKNLEKRLLKLEESFEKFSRMFIL